MSAEERSEYVRKALAQGRPENPCECDDCECPLHAYDADRRCVWCRNGVHADESGEGHVCQALGGYVPVTAEDCLECVEGEA